MKRIFWSNCFFVAMGAVLRQPGRRKLNIVKGRMGSVPHFTWSKSGRVFEFTSLKLLKWWELPFGYRGRMGCKQSNRRFIIASQGRKQEFSQEWL